MGCYEQPAITAITPVMAAPITLTGVKKRAKMQEKKQDFSKISAISSIFVYFKRA